MAAFFTTALGATAFFLTTTGLAAFLTAGLALALTLALAFTTGFAAFLAFTTTFFAGLATFFALGAAFFAGFAAFFTGLLLALVAAFFLSLPLGFPMSKNLAAKLTNFFIVAIAIEIKPTKIRNCQTVQNAGQIRLLSMPLF
ncbi:MAG TPA: hypothetical protein VG603_10510 [Chitinophagales bacterium]|nr:hypothetical protein [Chitinophagales bacterium]